MTPVRRSPPHGMFCCARYIQVFDEFSTQEEVYRECLSSFPHRLMQGINVTAFAYGPRGTGERRLTMFWYVIFLVDSK
jgi:Kinesin motor domain